MAKIQGRFNWNKPEVYTSFVQGAEAQTIYRSLKGNMANGISYDRKTKTLVGSNVFAAARIDSILRHLGIRVANLRDLSRSEVMAMVKDNHYTDAPALILRSTDDSYEANLPIIKQLVQAVEKANGQLQLPLMVTGFDVRAEKDAGYGIVVVPRDDFKAVSDPRLSGENDGKRFTEVDELGLPKFDSNGNRGWYAKSHGLSGLYLDGLLDVFSRCDNLALSDGNGRVVLVSAEGTAKNLERRL
ncbi:MAG: hypothetical protein AABX73_02395 [Nanoarchaeota archaeon]